MMVPSLRIEPQRSLSGRFGFFLLRFELGKGGGQVLFLLEKKGMWGLSEEVGGRQGV